jgi:hypothetical protein
MKSFPIAERRALQDEPAIGRPAVPADKRAGMRHNV